MLSVCMHYVRDRETARDLLQDGFIKVFTKVGTYTGQGSFEGWIRRIFVTTALEYLRAKDAIKQSVSLEDYPEAGEDLQGNVLDKLSTDELLECIGKLPGATGPSLTCLLSRDIPIRRSLTCLELV